MPITRQDIVMTSSVIVGAYPFGKSAELLLSSPSPDQRLCAIGFAVEAAGFIALALAERRDNPAFQE